MSATETLRRLLDERGVEHYDGTECTLWDYEQTSESTGCYRCSADEIRDGFVNVWMHHLTPAQAIDATLGRGTCEDIGFDDGYDEGLDGEWFALAPATWFLSCDHEAHGQRPSYCPVCGRKVKEG